MGSYRVGIVGFGVAGGALAVLLARAGHAVTVFERAPQLGPVGAGILLQPSGQLVLKRLGLLEEVISRAEPIHALHAFKAAGGTLVHLRYDESTGPMGSAFGVHRGTLFGALHAAVLRQNVAVCVDCEIVSWRVEAGQVFVADTRGESHGPFDFVACADGSRSALRRSVDPGLRQHEYEFGAMWAVGRCSKVRGYLHQVTRGTRNLAGLLPIGDGRCTLFWSAPSNGMETLRRAGLPKWRDEVIGLCSEAEEVFADVTDFDQVAFTTYQRVAMPRWHNGHIVCLGDAAHAMSPHLGQGANLALLDAECLGLSLQEADSPRSAFAVYQSRRVSHVRYYAALSALLTPFFQSEGWLLGLGRDIGLPLMARVPPLRREMELAMAGVKRGFFGGNIDST